MVTHPLPIFGSAEKVAKFLTNAAHIQSFLWSLILRLLRSNQPLGAAKHYVTQFCLDEIRKIKKD